MENNKSPANNEERKYQPSPPSPSTNGATSSATSSATIPTATRRDSSASATNTAAMAASTSKVPRKKGPPRKLKFLTKGEWARLSEVTHEYTEDLSEDQIEELLGQFVDENGERKYDGKKLMKSFWDKKKKAEGKAAKPTADRKEFEGEEREQPQLQTRGQHHATAQAVTPANFTPQDIANLLAEFAKYPAPRRPPWKAILESVGLPELAVQSWWFFEKERRKQAAPQMNAGPMMGSGRQTTDPVPMFTPPPLPSGPTDLQIGPPLQLQPAGSGLPLLPQHSTALQPAGMISMMAASPAAPPAAPGFDMSPIPPDVVVTNNGDGVGILYPELQRMKLTLFEAIASISGSEDEGEN